MAKKKYKNTLLHSARLFNNGGVATNVASSYSSLGNKYREQGLFPEGTNDLTVKETTSNSIDGGQGTGTNNGGGGNFMSNASQVAGIAGMFDSIAQSATASIDASRSGTTGQPQVLVEGVLGGQSGSHLGNMWNTSAKTREAINYVNNLDIPQYAINNSDNLLAQYSDKRMDNLNIDTTGKEWEDAIFDPASWLLTKGFGLRESASERQRRINEAINAANARQRVAYDSAVDAFRKNQARNVLANYRAFGGPIYGYMSDGAIAYDMARDNLMAKMWNAQNKSQGGSTTNVFDKGGPLFDYDLGISLVNAGGSHEKNPFGGVPMGKAPDGEDNVVEEGESIFKNYVFSKRLPVPKAIRNKYKMRSTNFSDMFKEYLKKNGIDERENDPIAQNGLMAFASDLMVSQEMVRAKENKGKNSAHAYPTGGKILHDPSKTKENYFNDLYAEGSDYMNAINWYNDPAHTKERDALIAAINAGNFDTDIEKINGYTVTPDNWYALATDYKKGPVHNAILNRMNTIKRMDLMTPIGIPDEVNPIMKMGPDGKYELGYGPWTGKGGPQGLIGVPPMDGGASGNGADAGTGNGALSVTSPYSKIGNRARMAGLFANLGSLYYNAFDPYRPGILDEISDFNPISGTPVGEYAPIFHTDTRYNSNQLAQQAAAARNAIMNTTNPNRNAALLAADYNAQVAQGDMLRKDAIADYETLLKTLAFNRETSKYNSGLDLDVAKANMTGRQAHDSAKLQQEQYNVTNLDTHKRAKDAAFAQGISNIIEYLNASNRERDNLAMVGALRESGALASNDAMDLLYNYLAGVRPAKTKSKNGKK